MLGRGPRRLDRLSGRDRKLLRRVLLRKALKEWWYTPGASFRPPPRNPVRMMDYVRGLDVRDGDPAGRAIAFFTRLAFPLLGDYKALTIECASDGARGWVEGFFDGGRPKAFRHAESVMRWLQWVTEDLMCEPLAVRKVQWQQDGSFETLRLLPRGVEYLRGGGYRVYPPEAHWWYQEDHPANPYDLGEEEILIFRRPAVLGDAIPLFRALPHIFDGWLAGHRMIEGLGARTFREDGGIRAQAARLRRFSLPAKALPNSRAARALNASLLELHNLAKGAAGILGLEGHDEYAPVTEHYLAWQHREALRAAGAVRAELIGILGKGLFRRSAFRAGFEAPDLCLRPRNAPSQGTIDKAFDDYVAGRVDIFGYHEQTRWT